MYVFVVMLESAIPPRLFSQILYGRQDGRRHEAKQPSHVW